MIRRRPDIRPDGRCGARHERQIFLNRSHWPVCRWKSRGYLGMLEELWRPIMRKQASSAENLVSIRIPKKLAGKKLVLVETKFSAERSEEHTSELQSPYE